MSVLPIVDPEFSGLIPPLTLQEREQLEHNIRITRKCYDPIIIWDGVIIDGHNRFEICMEHEIEFEVKEMDFSSREEAKVWMLDNQLGRRNLSDAARIEIVLLKEEILRERARKRQSLAGGDKTGGKCEGALLPKKTSQSDERIHVQEALAAEAGIGKGTLHRYQDIKKSGNPELIKQVIDGKLKIGTAHKMLEKELFKQLSSIDKMLKFIAENAHKDTTGQIYEEMQKLSGLQQMLIEKLKENEVRLAASRDKSYSGAKGSMKNEQQDTSN